MIYLDNETETYVSFNYPLPPFPLETSKAPIKTASANPSIQNANSFVAKTHSPISFFKTSEGYGWARAPTTAATNAVRRNLNFLRPCTTATATTTVRPKTEINGPAAVVPAPPQVEYNPFDVDAFLNGLWRDSSEYTGPGQRHTTAAKQKHIAMKKEVEPAVSLVCEPELDLNLENSGLTPAVLLSTEMQQDNSTAETSTATARRSPLGATILPVDKHLYQCGEEDTVGMDEVTKTLFLKRVANAKQKKIYRDRQSERKKKEEEMKKTENQQQLQDEQPQTGSPPRPPVSVPAPATKRPIKPLYLCTEEDAVGMDEAQKKDFLKRVARAKHDQKRRGKGIKRENPVPVPSLCIPQNEMSASPPKKFALTVQLGLGRTIKIESAAYENLLLNKTLTGEVV